VAILPVPRILPAPRHDRALEGRPQRTIFLSDIIKLCAGDLFPGYRSRARTPSG
jgi:polyphosphate kinase